MKHYRLINVGKGVLNITSSNIEAISGILGGGGDIIIGGGESNTSFYIGTWWVEKAITKTSKTVFELGDKIKGYVDVAETEWIEGVVLIDNIVIPTDIHDASKFFKTNEKLKL